ncbi:MAG: NAD-dependent epimerase/dehydratase family protein [Alphaproteobacteria bacterium]|nr:NAD-dependent epimerase/dehydratase family protein [Alphaproteobacteria bacterium]
MTAPFYLDSDIDEVVALLGDVAQDFAGKTVVISGGRGFLGRYFVEVFERMSRKALSSPVKVVILDNLITAGKRGEEVPQSEHIRFVRHNVIEPFAIEGPVHFVIHAAGIASPFYYRAYPLETLDVAVRGTRNMLDFAMNKGARLTFFSSSEIYGDPDPNHVPTVESYRGHVSSMGPRACYDESKRTGETLCYIFHDSKGVITNVIRPFNVYGPGMQETDYRVLPNFASRIKAGKPLNVYGSGKQTRTFCYITDAINGFLRVIARGVPGEAYNVGNPRPEISMHQLVLAVQEVLGKPVAHNLIEYPDTYPADEPNRRCPDIRKAKLQLDYVPQVDLKDGLRRFLRWTDATYTGEQ